MAYADYMYYSTEYLGTTISQSIFDHYAKKASTMMDYFTIGNTSNATTILDEMKDCCCAVADTIYKDEQRNTDIQSENNDGYSVTYKSDATTEKKVSELVCMYLSNTGLLYRGGAFL